MQSLDRLHPRIHEIMTNLSCPADAERPLELPAGSPVDAAVQGVRGFRDRDGDCGWRWAHRACRAPHDLSYSADRVDHLLRQPPAPGLPGLSLRSSHGPGHPLSGASASAAVGSGHRALSRANPCDASDPAAAAGCVIRHQLFQQCGPGPRAGAAATWEAAPATSRTDLCPSLLGEGHAPAPGGAPTAAPRVPSAGALLPPLSLAASAPAHARPLA